LPCRAANGIVEFMPPRRDAQVAFPLLAASLKVLRCSSLTSNL
jgi:hypothetical protein